MAKKEVKTDTIVLKLLENANLDLTQQGCDVKEISDALKTASKNLTGKEGYPEYCGVVNSGEYGDFVLVIEDKANLKNHVKKNDKDLIDDSKDAIKDYAVNGAYHYAKHILENTSYKKCIAFGVSGDSEKSLKITPIFVEKNVPYLKVQDDVSNFISFAKENIAEYYTRNILNEKTNDEKATEEVLKDAAELHEYLRNYGQLRDTEKPIVVSGILIALNEIEKGSFNLDSLNGDSVDTDGAKIFTAIEKNLKRANVSPTTKLDKILNQFSILKDSVQLNEIHPDLKTTPLRKYANFLYEKIFKHIRYSKSSTDFLGLFYGEFMSYSGSDGQTLGIILTPKHICDLFCDLMDLKKTDKVFDPCCGSGGFLVSAMHNMLAKANNDTEKRNIRQNQLYGIEIKEDMFTLATTNMILRGDGKSNLECDDFFKRKGAELQEKGCNVGMMNPPYSQGKKSPSLCELSFVEHLLDSLTEGAKAIVIVPQSAMTGKSNYEISYKEQILKKHTLEGVITCNKNTFYGVGTDPCIAIFTSGIPHDKDKEVKFINFEDDGFEVRKHIGLVETEAAKDKKQHLLDVWFDRIDANSKFCVKSKITYEDEWLHSYFYFNDEIPSMEEFEKTMADYLTFQFNMVSHGREYLFNEMGDIDEKTK